MTFIVPSYLMFPRPYRFRAQKENSVHLPKRQGSRDIMFVCVGQCRPVWGVRKVKQIVQGGGVVGGGQVGAGGWGGERWGGLWAKGL